jgi:hypothetical protein
MGVRLYPIAKAGVSNVEVFNRVASIYGSKPLSPERLEAYTSLVAKRESGEIDSDEYFETLYNGSNDDIQAFNSFELFGFGKFQSAFEAHRDYSGEERGEYGVHYLCVMNDIPTEVKELVDGFYWC